MKGDRKPIFFLIKKKKEMTVCNFTQLLDVLHSFEEGVFKSTLTRLSVPIQFSILCEF